MRITGHSNMPQQQSQMQFAQQIPATYPQQQQQQQQHISGMFPGNMNQASNHALQDYQMQLMLLEQQNKKRLLQARRDQENIIQPGQPGGQGFPPNMSPSGSRGGGPSPNPTDQMKRNPAQTPKMNPQSPMPDIQNRGSPAPGFDQGQMNMAAQQQFANMNPMNRPPSSHPNFSMGGNLTPQQIEHMRIQNRMPNGPPWPQGQPGMQPNAGNQQAPQPIGTPGQRNTTMPPPPAPAADQQVGQQRTQPSSPANTPAPPTPSQTAKGNPKGKKETAKTKVCLQLDDRLCA